MRIGNVIQAEATYILYRQRTFDGQLEAPFPVSSLADYVFWNTWRTRQAPYSVLTRGDTLYLLRRSDRHLISELRVAHVTRTRFHTLRDAGRQLERVFGVDLEAAAWPPNPATAGWLLAYNCDVIRELDVPTPASFKNLARMGRNGFIAWRRIPASARRSLLAALPAPGGRPLSLASCPSIGVLQRRSDRSHQRTRYIPQEVSRAVWERDGLRRRGCGTTRPPFQLDHVRPFSKGGRTTDQNLQVLCQSCNLEKGARYDWQPRG